QPDNAEEHVRPVLVAQFFRLIGMRIHPVADALHAHLLPRDFLAFDQHAANRGVGMTIMGIVVDTQHGAVFKPNARRSLNLAKQEVDGTLDPADLEPLTVERTVLDLSAIKVGHERAVGGSASRAAPVGKSLARLIVRGRDEVAGPAIDRDSEFPGWKARA